MSEADHVDERELSNPFKGLDKPPLPDGEWQKQLAKAAREFNEANPPFTDPIDMTPPVLEKKQQKARNFPSKLPSSNSPLVPHFRHEPLAPRSQISDQQMAELNDPVNKDTQRRWYQFLGFRKNSGE